jgi:hypothetical protein
MFPSAVKQVVIQWYGYTIDGMRFQHCLEMDDALLEASSVVLVNSATVMIKDPELHVKMILQLLDEELKHMVDDSWDWKVRQLNEYDFMVVFPNEASLKLCKNMGDMTLPVSKIAVIFAKPKADPFSAAMISKIWIFISRVPACLRKSELLLEGTKMLGRPRLVDEDSLP